ncbi:hypothetical protein AZE42_03552 [Rhizopogon vesiculosus]|uniref:Uncharacterized protein n=1 Tax=Rhizopogon vesiculosus TaxID=180088 RepID=A0A1J8Q9W1_9AGAM|nr:hypothetical protein AZE42_03552 [Rhizopogon vesiculosus]
MSDISSRKTRKGRSSSLHLPKQCDPIPIPPSLANSPHLLSPYSIFRRKSAVLKTPSKEHDEWLRDMVPLDWDKGTFGKQLSSMTSAAISVPTSETSPDHSPSSSSESSTQSLTMTSQRHHIHRPWSSPSTPCLISADLRPSDSSDDGLTGHISTYSFLGHVFLFGSYDGHMRSIYVSPSPHPPHRSRTASSGHRSSGCIRLPARSYGSTFHLFVVSSWVMSFLLGLMMGIMRSSICVYVSPPPPPSPSPSHRSRTVSVVTGPLVAPARLPVRSYGSIYPPIRFLGSCLFFWVLCWVYVI